MTTPTWQGEGDMRLHGSKLNLVAGVRLPVSGLFQAQQHRLQEGIEQAGCLGKRF